MRKLIRNSIFCLTSLAAFLSAHVASGQLKFESQTIDEQIDKVCYGVTTADVNSDGKLDLVGVSNRAVYWYQNPTWKRHTIIADQTLKDNVCIAAHDIDGDEKVDFALGAGWTGTGTIQWLKRGDDLSKPWSVHQIGVERWTHRMRFADVLGKGTSQLVVSPLNKTVGNGVRLLVFEIPANPLTDRWPTTVLNHELNRVHNHWHLDYDGDGRVDTLAASEQGVALISPGKSGFESRMLTRQGAGEIKVGQFVEKAKMLVTIEPMHGTAAVVYSGKGDQQQRTVLVETLKQGHAVWVANMDNDPEDEILIGHREKGSKTTTGPGLYLFDYDSLAKQWKQQTIDDGGCAVEDALVADFNGDGKPDIAAGGRSTHNIKIYFQK